MPVPVPGPSKQPSLADRELQSTTPSFPESFNPGLAPHDNDHARLLSPPITLLRKSISVDSFVSRDRLSPAQDTARSRAYTAAAPSPQPAAEQSWSARNRGDSVSSAQGGYSSSISMDSDVERFDPVDRFRHTSLKTGDSQRPVIRGGELPLPSRTQALSTASSVTSVLTASTSSSTREPHPALRSVPSLGTSIRPPQPSWTAPPSTRSRSGSLGVYIPHPQNRRMTINTHAGSSQPTHTITLTVLGTATCGKSSVIRKGLAKYSLSDSVTSHAPDNPAIRYTRKIGRIPSESIADCSLHVVEVDIPSSLSTPPPMPPDLSPLDGVIICYDASNPTSFQPVETLLKEYRGRKLPIIVLACKTDLERLIEPDRASELLQEYDVGLVEVSSTQDTGKAKMRQSFDWLVKAVFRARQAQMSDDRNPASPGFLRNGVQSWDTSRNATPTTLNAISTVPFGPSSSNGTSSISTSTTSASPISPTRARSTGDLLFEKERARLRSAPTESLPPPPDLAVRPRHTSEARDERPTETSTSKGTPVAVDSKLEKPKKDPPQAQWATLEELLDKLLFLAVSGDDPAFVSHFLLTYRRFATPRNVLLAMQKRMRELDHATSDPMFACFAQMRICHLLETWIQDYPDDFAVRGTYGALDALIKTIIRKTHLLHYGSEFLPFIKKLSYRSDQDSSWALKTEAPADESDDSYSLLEKENDVESSPRDVTDSPTSGKSRGHETSPMSPPPNLRERKSSLPLAKAILGNGSSTDHPSPKQQLKELTKLAQDVLNTDSEDIAKEITRQWVSRFMDIKPRDWLHYTFISSKKPDKDPITDFNVIANHLADWVVSLILCHDRPRHRARQVEKFVDIAHRLRMLNNYSALRAIVAGINSATFPGDETMEVFKNRSPEQAKNLQSFDVLLQQIRAHRAYRLALRNSKGACIPAMEVHMSDLIRANEGNGDFNESDPSKIHWGKFNMMGRFVDTTTQCQIQCSNSNDYNFPERPHIAELFTRRSVMSPELVKARLALLDTDLDEPKTTSVTHPRDIVGLRKMFFW